jgi:heme-degrading monooxygenase HmoA
MYVQVVTYALDGVEEDEYLDIANELAPRFSGLPGLQAKIWLDDPDRGRYGAVYFWQDRDSMERFLRSDLFEGTNREFVKVESEGFAILENLTAQTQPDLQVVEGRRRTPAARSLPEGGQHSGRPAGSSGPGRTAKKAAPKKTAAKRASSKT